MAIASIKDKRILIAGASGGIGLACAQMALKEEAFVLGSYRAMNEKLSSLNETYPDRLTTFELDISDRDKTGDTVRKAVRSFGGIDAVINCIGVTSPAPLFSADPDEWEKTVKTDLFSAFRIMQSVIVPLVSRRGGAVVNISSVYGSRGGIGQSSYCAAKAGIEGLTRAAALELAGKNIRVNAVAPGFIETNMTDVLDERFRQKALSEIPMKRFGTADEVAALCLFLISDAAAYITGQTFTADGGLSI